MEPLTSTSDGVIALAEKVNILKSVSIFFDTPPETLVEVAELLEQVDVKAGQAIFEKGDMGASMYIVVEGSVWIHDGDMTLNYLGPRDVFGEMAALDPEPVSYTHLVYGLVTSRPRVSAAGPKVTPDQPMVGREAELDLILEKARQAASGNG